MMTRSEFPSFMAGSFVKDYPLYGSVAVAINTLFVERLDTHSRVKVVLLDDIN